MNTGQLSICWIIGPIISCFLIIYGLFASEIIPIFLGLIIIGGLFFYSFKERK